MKKMGRGEGEYIGLQGVVDIVREDSATFGL